MLGLRTTTYDSMRNRASATVCFRAEMSVVVVDPKSFIYLHGMILDYSETLMPKGKDRVQESELDQSS